MATKVVFTDFRGGMIDEKFRRRSDMSGYYNSASLIENAVPTRAGGVCLRPGMERKSAPLNAERIISYTESAELSYVVVLSDNKAEIFGIDASGNLSNVGGTFITGISSADIPYVQHAQDYERLILAHKDCAPYVIATNRAVGGFSGGPLRLDTARTQYRIDGKTESDEEYDYNGLFSTEGKYPSCVAFMGQRLWFMGTRENPYRMWASRPFKYNNFQESDQTQMVDESVTTEQYLEAIEGSKFVREDLFITDDDGQQVYNGYKETIREVSYDAGIITWTINTYNVDGELVNTETKSAVYTKPEYSWQETIREDNAIVQDMASDRDETAVWLGYASNMMFIGSTSSEWAIPSDISAINGYITKISSYGAAKGIQCVYGADSLFYVQSGRKKIRALTYSANGLSYSEPSFICESVLSAGIKEMHWQRVPHQRLYCLLKDGSIAVYTYDSIYGISAWCIWKSVINIKSMCIMDTEDGQEVIVLGEHPNGSKYLFMLDDSIYTDDGYGYTAKIVTNNIEGDGTIPYRKKNYNVYVDSNKTEFKAMQNGLSPLTPRAFDTNLVKLDLYSRTTLEGLRIEIRSVEKKPFELLALGIEVEVSE